MLSVEPQRELLVAPSVRHRCGASDCSQRLRPRYARLQGFLYLGSARSLQCRPHSACFWDYLIAFSAVDNLFVVLTALDVLRLVP